MTGASARIAAALVGAATFAAARSAAAEPGGDVGLDLAVALGLQRPFVMGDVNRALADADAGTLALLTPTVGVVVRSVHPSGFVLEPSYTFSITSGPETTLTWHDVGAAAGWVVAARGEARLTAFLGLGYANVHLGVSRPDPTPSPFGDAVERPTGDAEFAGSAFVARPGVDAVLWGSGYGDFVGLRTGLVLPIVATAFKRQGREVPGAPTLPAARAELALVLGWHLGR